MTEQPDNHMDEFRRFVEQEVNAISVGQDRTEMPKDMGLLIPSLDLQKATNRIVAKADQYYADFYRNKILEARVEGAVMGAKYGNAAFRQYNIADPSKPVNLDTVRQMGIDQATEWAERQC